ncbi:SDR family oxidoreductase [Pseudohalioglobus lutimaris]|uniref:Short-chain dehydrogenase/reductase n=1 Tax=Pseudohalioglobus lutimaris TaxID=1737061 RepID=A0A2N5X5V3_9GAMM|nr:SDR family oxidoreductase [Pseudohalioglobus lutimaris]PLW69857.1 short-chain dehydrogenase/reductase [Pseudohalioglobus lutimaris]
MNGSTPQSQEEVVLITGASSGFGLQMADKLSAAGYRVFGTGLEDELSHPRATLLQMNVNDDDSVDQCVDRIMAQAGRIDVLINNAGFGICGAVEDTSIEEARAQFETNYFGAIRMLRKVLPIMRKQDSGRIIAVGSLGGEIALPFQSHYCATKFSTRALSDALRLELHGSPIDATVIQPGDFATGFTASRRFSSESQTSHLSAQLKTTMAIVERDEKNGADPDLLGDLCLRLVRKRKLKPVYNVGGAGQRAAALLKRLVPASWFEALMVSSYKL